MLTMLSRYWWVVALRGAVAILFGILTLFYPGLALATLVTLFGFYALVDGISMAVMAVQSRKQKNWWLQLVEGFVGVIAGILTIAYPGVTALILLYIIAVWAFMTGIFEVWAALHLRKEITGELWLGIAGILSVLFALFLVLRPGEGALAVASIIGIYAIVFGVMLVLLALRVRSFGQTPHAPPATA